MLAAVPLCWMAPGMVAAGAQHRPAGSAVDPDTGVVHSARLTNGVPLGGIGAGSVELMTDGTFSGATINNNWTRPIDSMPGCFAALWTRVGDRSQARVIALHSAYGLPTVPGLDYTGEFPEADMLIIDDSLPVQASIRAFSPFIPYDIGSSSFPAAAIIFSVRNTTAYPVDVSVALSWEDTLGVGATLDGRRFSDRTGDTVTAQPSADGYDYLRFTGPPLHDPPSDVDNATGDMTLMAHASQADAVVTRGAWNTLSSPAWWNDFAHAGDVSGAVPAGIEGTVHPAGVVALRLRLQPRSYFEAPFAVAWYTPHLYTGTRDLGHYYEISFTDSHAAARRLLTDWRMLQTLSTELRFHIDDSDLPRWLARRVTNALTPLVTNTIHLRDERLYWLSSTGDSSAPGGPRLASELERLDVCSAILCLFPRLQAASLLEDLAEPRAQDLLLLPRTVRAIPGFPAEAGQAEHGLGPPVPTSALTLREVETISAFVLQAAQFVLWSGDTSFRSAVLPRIRAALDTIASAAGSDGLPIAKPDRDAPSGAALSPRLALIWAAAARAGAELADGAQDRATAARWRQAAARAERGALSRYWQGVFRGAGSTSPPILDTGELMGQWFATLLGIGDLEPPGDLRIILSSVHAAERDAPGRSHLPPAAAAANGDRPTGDAPVCTVDDTVLADADMALTLAEPAEGLATLGRLTTATTEGMCGPWRTSGSVDLLTGRSAQPGEASLAAAADWCDLFALEGVRMRLDEGELTVMPEIPGDWRAIRAPVFGPDFWAHISYQPRPHGEVFTFRLDRLGTVGTTGEVRRFNIARLHLPSGPLGGEAPTVRVTFNNVPVTDYTFAVAGDALTVVFQRTQGFAAGDTLEVEER